MLGKKIIRLCAVLVLGAFFCTNVQTVEARTLYRDSALNMIDETGHVHIPDDVTRIGSNAFMNTGVSNLLNLFQNH